MLIIRPLNFADLEALERLADSARGSLTTLPANRDHLSELVSLTQQSLTKEVGRAGEESYHFVLEETDSGNVVGISGIEAAVGLRTPFYSYRIDEIVHASSELQIHNRIPALHLCQDYTGNTRLCSLFLDQHHRDPAALHLLSRSRMLFMAQHPQRFARRTLAELQGLQDENGQSPFWECLGRHFFEMEFAQADYLTSISSKGFIADLMPHYPVYATLLSAEARAALGQPRPDVEVVMDLLEDEGFTYKGYVDIFDAGPTLEVRSDDIRSVYMSRNLPLQISEEGGSDWVLVSNNKLQDYRCALVRSNAAAPTLTAAEAAALKLEAGDEIRCLKLDAGEIELADAGVGLG
ncbi:arginine N-succinyltransferase [Marinobacterium jannaschii]|uniref:arginine N-succinyltransferase n=1 Tax=Marinobacterium jannaschii TaxID=64970 RepID=UPI000486647B|nr:arginine N-succinyltransferase [Marinobacterium jannaschii]